jgi:ADP-ribose pyrophosphatase YjhB (NUDIX family)
MKRKLTCPRCGATLTEYRNPTPTVDIIIECKGKNGKQGVVLIERRNPPPGWALPGGYVDYGESLEEAAMREAREETGLKVRLVRQFHSYSAPGRDPRQHNISTVFIATAQGVPEAADDAKKAGVFAPEELPVQIAFDHRQILQDYFQQRY